MKNKLLLTLGTTTLVMAPIMTVVACGGNEGGTNPDTPAQTDQQKADAAIELVSTLTLGELSLSGDVPTNAEITAAIKSANSGIDSAISFEIEGTATSTSATVKAKSGSAKSSSSKNVSYTKQAIITTNAAAQLALAEVYFTTAPELAVNINSADAAKTALLALIVVKHENYNYEIVDMDFENKTFKIKVTSKTVGTDTATCASNKTFSVILTTIETKEQYLAFINESSFNDSFKTKAINAIDWATDENGIVIAGAFEGINIPQDYRLPRRIVGLRDNSFKGAQLPDNFSFPVTIKSIGANAFQNVILPTGFTIPSTVTSIGNSVFSGATLPSGFTIPSTVTSIGREAFSGATLPSGFTIPSTVTSISDFAFSGATLPSGFTILSTLKSIGDYAFVGATLPSGTTDYNTYIKMTTKGAAISTVKLNEGFTIPSSVTSIGPQAFAGATLPSGFTIPSSVTSIDYYAFKNATLPSGFALPSSVTTIGTGAFQGATLPSGFTIPSSVTSIGIEAFLRATLGDQPISSTNPIVWDGHPNITS